MTAPARRYTWPPFEPGNAAALKHGAYAERTVGPIAEQLRAELLEAAPWTSGRTFHAAVAAWSWAEAQCVVLRDFINERGLLDDDDEPRPALALLDRAEARADRTRAQLGLTPTAWVQLRRAWVEDPDRSTGGLAALVAAGREMLEARPPTGAGTDEGGTT